MAETHEQVVKVWIEPGCIVCDACETDCPEVFEVQEETCIIRPQAMSSDFTKPLTPSIQTAAEGCPVEVIKFETIAVEGAAPWAGQEAESAAGHTAGAAAEAARGPAIPAGPPDPKWSALLSAATISARGRHEEAQAPATIGPARAPAEAIAAALPADAPPDAHAAAMVGAGFVRPRRSLAEQVRARSDGLSRREAGLLAGTGVLLFVAWGSIAAWAATCAAAFQSFFVPRLTKEPPSIFRAGRVTDFTEPGVYEQYKGTQGVWMVHLPGGRLVAVSTVCTHLGCIPNWLANDSKFKCPCHGSGFRMDGFNFEGPAPRPLERLKIYREGPYVMVDKSKKFRQELGQWDSRDAGIDV